MYMSLLLQIYAARSKEVRMFEEQRKIWLNQSDVGDSVLDCPTPFLSEKPHGWKGKNLLT